MKLWIYVLRRLALTIPVLLGVTLITFYLSYGMGDPLAAYVTEKTTDAQYEALAEKHGINEPISVQYVIYLHSVITFDWGYSEVVDTPVSEALKYRFAATLELSILAFVVAVVTALPLGIYSSIRQNRWHDHSIRFFALLGSAIPIFWFALILQYIVVELNSYGLLDNWPITYRTDAQLWEIEDPIETPTNFLLVDAIAAGSWIHLKDALQHMILPATVLAYGSMATIIRLMRGNMLDVLGQDYIRTARAKGLSEIRIVIVHALRGGILPVISFLGPAIAGLLAGSFVVETIFQINGVGRFYVQAAFNRDYTMILGTSILFTFMTLTFVLISDIMASFLNPTLRDSGGLE